MKNKVCFGGLICTFSILILATFITGCGSAGVSSPTQGGTTNGTQSAGSLTATQTSVQFGNVPVGTSATQVLTFTNSASGSAVTISSLQISGTGFSLSQSPSLPATVAAGQSVSATVQVLPSAAGTLTGSLSAVSDGVPSTVSISLSAVGVATPTTTFSITGTISPAAGSAGATVSLSQNGVTSSTVSVDSNGNYSFLALSSGSYTVTPSKTNTTFSPVNQQVTINSANITGINFIETFTISGSLSASGSGATVALSGAATQHVTADSSGNYAFTGLPTGVYTITPAKTGYSFSPATSQVTIANTNVSGVTFTVLAGQLSISPSSFTFTNIALGSTSQPQSATLTATGGDVSITSDTLTGAGFGFSGITFPVTIKSRNSLTFSINFTPSSAGTTSGTLSFSNAQTILATAQLAGTGSGLAVSPSTLAFGQVLDGTTSSAQNVTLSAVGANVTVSSANLVQNGGGGNAFSITGLPALPFTMTAGQTAQFSLTFAPASGSPGTAAGSLTFASNVNSAVQTVAGTGAPNVLLSWTASPSASVTYRVYRCSISASACVQAQPSNFANIAAGIAGLNYVDSGVSSGQTYYYALTAVDQSSNESVFSTVSNAAAVP